MRGHLVTLNIHICTFRHKYKVFYVLKHIIKVHKNTLA